MRFSSLLAATALLTATGAIAQTAPQTAAPQTAPQTPATDTAAPATDTAAATPAPTTPTPSADAAPAGATVIPTTAATLVQPAVGVDVFDAAGTKAGTIKALTGQYVTIATAKGEVRLAKASIGPGPNGAVIGGTAAELEAAAARAGATPAARRTGRRG